MARQFRDAGTGGQREITIPLEKGYHAIIYRQPLRDGGRWSWQVDRGPETIASGWVSSLTEAKAAVEAALDRVAG